jgi:hypothetical protein
MRSIPYETLDPSYEEALQAGQFIFGLLSAIFAEMFYVCKPNTLKYKLRLEKHLILQVY